MCVVLSYGSLYALESRKHGYIEGVMALSCISMKIVVAAQV